MKKWILFSCNILVGTACYANEMEANQLNLIHDGLFLGLGTTYNSINLMQNSWGEGISNITTSTGADSNGIAQGSGAPFHQITDMFAPTVQAGYFKHIIGSQTLYGLKLSYQKLKTFATNSNLYIPQLGVSISRTGEASSLFGYVNASSVQVNMKHELTLLAFIGQSFGNKYVYFGIGPSVFNLQSKNYNSIGYADFEGATINVTGLINYSSPSVWLWGGAVQLGMTYFVSPTWFIDTSYTYTKTGSKTLTHEQTFLNTSSISDVDYTTSGTLFTRDTLSINNQYIMLTINKVLDL